MKVWKQEKLRGRAWRGRSGVTGVTSNLCPPYDLHAFVCRKSPVNAEEGFASIQQMIPKSTLANPIAVRFPPVEGNFHFFSLTVGLTTMIDTSKSSRFPLGENIPGVCLGRCCWSLETCWRGRRWQDGNQNVKQMRSKKNLCRICNHLYILAIGR